MKTIDETAQIEVETLFDEMIVEKLKTRIEELETAMSEVQQQQTKVLNAINMNVNAIKGENKKIIPEVEDLYENMQTEFASQTDLINSKLSKMLTKEGFEAYINIQKLEMEIKNKKLIVRLNIIIGIAMIIGVVVAFIF